MKYLDNIDGSPSRNCFQWEEKSWSVELLKIVPKLFSSSTCLHVTLIVLLRLVSITKPIRFRDSMVFQHRHKLIIGIWLVSIVIGFLPVFFIILKLDYLERFTKYLILHGFHTFPVICIVLMYIKLNLIIKKRDKEHGVENVNLNPITSNYMINKNIAKRRQNNLRQKSSTKIITRIVVSLVVLYLPYIIFWQYGSAVIIKRCPLKAHGWEVRLRYCMIGIIVMDTKVILSLS